MTKKSHTHTHFDTIQFSTLLVYRKYRSNIWNKISNYFTINFWKCPPSLSESLCSGYPCIMIPTPMKLTLTQSSHFESWNTFYCLCHICWTDTV